jgi:hypothetical protein
LLVWSAWSEVDIVVEKGWVKRVGMVEFLVIGFWWTRREYWV